MRKANTKISIVIPVFNEENEIHECLEAIARQTVAPHEVIVVDNNSTDATVAICRQFSFVKIIEEHRQGQRYAQITGFDTASSDIIVRIDADTRLENNHIEKLQTIFASKDVDAVSGYGVTRKEYVGKLSKVWSWFHYTYAHAYFGYPILWGANMAFRANYWNDVKKQLITEPIFHEDEDISLALASVGAKIKIVPSLCVSVRMDNMLDFKQFKNHYLRLMHELRPADALHTRSKLPTRLPKASIHKRSAMWAVSSWSVYFYYSVLASYYYYTVVRTELTTRLFLADRPQD
jgi:glycosyltransferase involved in cell wall biosynthesis